MGTKEVNITPHMKSLASCLTRIIHDGYTDDFRVSGKTLKSTESGKSYAPEEVSIINFFRFEGYGDPSDNSVLYVIKTYDGKKGTLIDSCGTYADIQVSRFIDSVERMHKKAAS